MVTTAPIEFTFSKTKEHFITRVNLGVPSHRSGRDVRGGRWGSKEPLLFLLRLYLTQSPLQVCEGC